LIYLLYLHIVRYAIIMLPDISALILTRNGILKKDDTLIQSKVNQQSTWLIFLHYVRTALNGHVSIKLICFTLHYDILSENV